MSHLLQGPHVKTEGCHPPISLSPFLSDLSATVFECLNTELAGNSWCPSTSDPSTHISRQNAMTLGLGSNKYPWAVASTHLKADELRQGPIPFWFSSHHQANNSSLNYRLRFLKKCAKVKHKYWNQRFKDKAFIEYCPKEETAGSEQISSVHQFGQFSEDEHCSVQATICRHMEAARLKRLGIGTNA